MSHETILERQEKIDYEWKDGDDSALYDSGWIDGINECIKILNDVAAQPELNKMPASFVVSVVTATLKETIGESNGNV
jgi:hypothetical protein